MMCVIEIDILNLIAIYDAEEVPDPYYGGDQWFEYVLDLLEDACDGLLKHILKEHSEIN